MATFKQLIKDSWKLAEEEQAATYIDEVFIGGVVSTMLESGHALFDMSSTGDYHNMMFENLDNQDRIIIQVRHENNALAEAKTLGHRMQFTCGYGMRAKKIGKLVSSSWRESLSGSLGDIGSIMYDVQGNYLFASMPLYIIADDYVDLDTLMPDFDKMAEDLSEIMEKLKEFVKVNVGA
ncbi:MAG TPA: hypothetical protein C5S51_06260 [Methanosarcinaceae archaeon]|nr:hypothetical protein [Methanosarcinaceae archaeon]